MKKIFSLFLVFILIFNFSVASFSYADTIDSLTTNDPKDVIGSFSSQAHTYENTSETSNQDEEDSSKLSFGLLEPIISVITDILGFIPSLLFKIVYILPNIDGIIFNTHNYFDIDIFSNKPDGICGSLRSSVAAVYNALRYLVTAIYIVVLVYLAIKMMVSSIGRQKAKYKDLFRYWFVGLLLLFSFHWVMSFFVWLSATIVKILADMSMSIMNPIVTGEALGGIGKADLPVTSYIEYCIRGAEGTSIVFGVLAFLLTPIFSLICAYLLIKSAFKIIITYFKRLFTVLILIILFPIVVLSYVFDKIGDRKAQTFERWFKEFTVNVMIQPIHALTLTFICIIFSQTYDSFLIEHNSLLAPVFALLCLRIIPLGEELLKQLFQISSQMGPGSHGIAGSAAQAGMAIRGMKESVNAVKNIGKGAVGAYKKRKAFEGIDSNSSLRSSIRNAGLRNGIKNWKNSEYMKDLKKDTHSKTATGALSKTYAPLLGIAGGVGSALVGAGKGRFASEAVTSAVMNSELLKGASSLPQNVREFRSGDSEKSKDYDNEIKGIDKLTEKQLAAKADDSEYLKKVSLALGITTEQTKDLLLSKGNKAKLLKNYSQVGNALRWDVDKEKAKDYSDIRKAQKDFDKAATEAGGWSNVIGNDTPVFQGKNGMYIRDTNNNLIKINEHGASSLGVGELMPVGTNSQVGQSIEQAVDENLKSNAEYMSAMHGTSSIGELHKMVKDTQKEAKRLEKDVDSKKRALDADPENEELKKEYDTACSNWSEASEASETLRTDYNKAKELRKSTRKIFAEADEILTANGRNPTFTETAMQFIPKDTEPEVDDATGRHYYKFNGRQYTITPSYLDPDSLNRYKESIQIRDMAINDYANGNTSNSETIFEAQAIGEAENRVKESERKVETAQAHVNSVETIKQAAHNKITSAEKKVVYLSEKVETAEENYATVLRTYETAKNNYQASRDPALFTDVQFAEKDLNDAAKALETVKENYRKAQNYYTTVLNEFNTASNNYNSANSEFYTASNDYADRKETLDTLLDTSSTFTANTSEGKSAAASIIRTVQADYESAKAAVNPSDFYATTSPAASAKAVFEFVRSQVDTSELDNAYAAYTSALNTGDDNAIANATNILSQVELKTNSQLATLINDYTKDPGSAIANGASDAVVAAFATNSAAQDTIKQPTIDVASLLTDHSKEAFCYGICDDLTNALDVWSNHSVTVSIIRNSNGLHYSVHPQHNPRMEIAVGDINIGDGFNNPDLETAGSNVEIANSNGIWYKK